VAEIIRKLHAGDTAALDALVSSGFEYPETSGFLADFPIWNPQLAVTQRSSTGIFSSDGTLMSHVGSRRWRYLVSDGHTFTVSTLGAIATDPSARGRGFASQLIRAAIQESEKQKDAYVVLWGGEHEFYSQFGFELSGSQWLLDLSTLPLDNVTEAPTVKSGFDERIFIELMARRSGPEFSVEDASWIRAHQTVRWFTLDEPFAFVGVGRGKDLPGIVHEYGGDTAGVKKILGWLHGQVPGIHWMGGTEECSAMEFEPSGRPPESVALVRRNTDTPWPQTAWISGLGSV
jgi:GNAT superfamily N-acetyltransferase